MSVSGLATFCVAAGISMSSLACSDSPPSDSTPQNAGPPDAGAAAPCPAGELAASDGSCDPAGVPAAGCAPGFVWDAGGCHAVMPPAACAPGTMALPGESTCREIAPCGRAPWGDLPVDALTQYVDASFSGTSDGSADKPWVTIGDALFAADDGALIAVATGTYVEDPDIYGKSVRLRGRCPALVEIVASGDWPEAVVIRGASASGSEVGGVAIRGAVTAVSVVGAEDVLLDQVWLHDLEGFGVRVIDPLGPASATVRSSLVESARDVALGVQGSSLTVERSVVRATRLGDTGLGDGVVAREGVDSGLGSVLAVRESVLEGHVGAAIHVRASAGTVDASLVRDTAPGAAGALPGGGVLVTSALDTPMRARGTLSVRSSVVERVSAFGVAALGADLAIEDSVVRDTLSVVGAEGRGIDATADGDEPSLVALTGSLVDNNREVGLFVAGSKATIVSTIVRGTLPKIDDTSGRGVGIESMPETDARAEVELRGCVVEDNHMIGVHVSASDAVLDSVVVRTTKPQASDASAGRGLNVQHRIGSELRSTAVVKGSLLEDNFEFGAVVTNSSLQIEGSTVRGTKVTPAGLYGDGLAIWTLSGDEATATIESCRIESSGRAGVASFGARVAVGQSQLDCNQIALDGEVYESRAFVFEDAGGNGCGCGQQSQPCAVQSSGLVPPRPL